ncbi:hypothetical protein [Frankia sp. CeD]|uniref:hypothetical protein n=1 Tax=Frankia sp. CeD TaxID=258230 RepID=UPI0004DD1F21|nr:hypothetical protein [Frankia sp. CeD]KEZ34859.1 hypothetical protein CEDDRAFT_03789 [Frankia sp. CeD]
MDKSVRRKAAVVAVSTAAAVFVTVGPAATSALASSYLGGPVDEKIAKDHWGKDGWDGWDGKDRWDGKDGWDGWNGKDGWDGKDRWDGKDGKDRWDGKDGKDRWDGKDGKDRRHKDDWDWDWDWD